MIGISKLSLLMPSLIYQSWNDFGSAQLPDFTPSYMITSAQPQREPIVKHQRRSDGAQSFIY